MVRESFHVFVLKIKYTNRKKQIWSYNKMYYSKLRVVRRDHGSILFSNVIRFRELWQNARFWRVFFFFYLKIDFFFNRKRTPGVLFYKSRKYATPTGTLLKGNFYFRFPRVHRCRRYTSENCESIATLTIRTVYIKDTDFPPKLRSYLYGK